MTDYSNYYIGCYFMAVILSMAWVLPTIFCLIENKRPRIGKFSLSRLLLVVTAIGILLGIFRVPVHAVVSTWSMDAFLCAFYPLYCLFGIPYTNTWINQIPPTPGSWTALLIGNTLCLAIIVLSAATGIRIFFKLWKATAL